MEKHIVTISPTLLRRPFQLNIITTSTANSIITCLTNYDIHTFFTWNGEIETMLTCGTFTSDSETDKVDEWIHNWYIGNDRVSGGRGNDI